MSNKPVRTYKKRSFSYYKKTQKISDSKQHYFQILPMILMFFGFVLTLIMLGLAIKFPEATWFFLLLWGIGTVILIAGLCFGYWVKRKLFGDLMQKKELTEIYHTMNALDFEHYVAEKFRRAGYQKVQVTKSLGDGGVDIFMEKDAIRYAVQCKKYHPESFVKIDELRAFVYAYRKAGAAKGMYVTTAKYSAVATKEMAEEGVELIDGARVLQEW